MAVARAAFEIRTDGDDDNGGGFVFGGTGTDYSQQAAAQKSGADLAIHATTTTRVQPVAAGVSVNDIGNVVNITAGTGFTPGRYEIVSIWNATHWQMDRAVGTGGSTGGTYKMGGAFASLGGAAAASILGTVGGNGNYVWIRSGTYVLTSDSYNVSGGCFQATTAGNMFVSSTIRGYETTRGDRGARPVIQVPNDASITSQTIIRCEENTWTLCDHIEVDGQAQAGIEGFLTGGRDEIHSCVARGCVDGFDPNAATFLLLCEAYSCTTSGFEGGRSHSYCMAVGCGIGFKEIGGATNCIAHDCTGDGYTTVAASYPTMVNCVSDGNGGDGFDISNGGHCVSCVATNNTGYGFNGNDYASLIRGCFGRSNTSGNYSTIIYVENFTALTADPYENLAGHDFRPNNTAGGGAELRGASVTPLAYGTVNYADAGALQHEDAGGGGGGLKIAGSGGLAG